MSNAGASLDYILTNHPGSFQKSSLIETGTSDHHKLVITFLRAHFQKIPPKNIIYRNYKYFDQCKFLSDLKEISFGNIYSGHKDAYDILTNKFKELVDKHAPQKEKKVRGNQAPFMTKEFSKALMTRSRLRNKYNKWKSRENYLAYQDIKKKCKTLGKKDRSDHFQKATEN